MGLRLVVGRGSHEWDTNSLALSQRLYQVYYARRYPIVPVKLAARGMRANYLGMSGLTLVQAYTETDQSEDRRAYHEVHEDAPIEACARMAELRREMRRERKSVNRVAEQNGNEVLKPSPGSGTEELPRCGHRLIARREGERGHIRTGSDGCKPAATRST